MARPDRPVGLSVHLLRDRTSERSEDRFDVVAVPVVEL